MDESDKQLASHVKAPLPVAPVQPLRIGDEHIRHGVVDIFSDSGSTAVFRAFREAVTRWIPWISHRLLNGR
jgi:hypothetical protein